MVVVRCILLVSHIGVYFDCTLIVLFSSFLMSNYFYSFMYVSKFLMKNETGIILFRKWVFDVALDLPQVSFLPSV